MSSSTSLSKGGNGLIIFLGGGDIVVLSSFFEVLEPKIDFRNEFDGSFSFEKINFGILRVRIIIPKKLLFLTSNFYKIFIVYDKIKMEKPNIL